MALRRACLAGLRRATGSGGGGGGRGGAAPLFLATRRGGAAAPPAVLPQRRAFSAEESAKEVKVPSLEEASAMPESMCSLSNESVYVLAELGHFDACTERLVRHVMKVDGVDWITAKDIVKQIDRRDRELLWLATMPFKIGIAGSVTAAVASVPMVFHKKTCERVNEVFVTTDVPEPADLQTMWEVGSWAWNWMEPPLGVASFVILAMQLCRSQMQNLDWKPYTCWVKDYRANRLADLYPQYSHDIITEYSLSASMGRKSR